MSRTLIIAELGINHNGNMLYAMEMIERAQIAGADVAKFQYYDPDLVLGKDHPLNAYAKQCQFTKKQLEELAVYANNFGIDFGVSVFTPGDVRWANDLVTRHKVASRMNMDKWFQDVLLDTGKPIITSLGNVGQNPTELNMTAYDMWQGYSNVSLLYCVTNYPTQLHEFDMANLELVHGLSSHCPSIAPSLFAVAQGCDVLENHVTLDRQMPGCDHAASLTFDELADMVRIVREMETLTPINDCHG